MDNLLDEDLSPLDASIEGEFAGFWRRVGATVIDTLLVLSLFPLSYYNMIQWKSMPLLLVLATIPLLYKNYCEYTWGATLGKYLNGIVVTTENFQKPSLKDIIFRNCFNIAAGLVSLGSSIYVFSQPAFATTKTFIDVSLLTAKSPLAQWSNIFGLLILVDILVIFGSPQKQTLHDKIAKTFVLRH